MPRICAMSTQSGELAVVASKKGTKVGGDLNEEALGDNEEGRRPTCAILSVRLKIQRTDKSNSFCGLNTLAKVWLRNGFSQSESDRACQIKHSCTIQPR